MTWPVERCREDAATFHERQWPAPVTRAAWVCDPTGAALVLGSSQTDAVVDHAACAAAGVAVVRRHSGGGAVLVEPGRILWVDLVLPAGDPLWDADVGRAFLWVGDAWAAALTSCGVAASVHGGGLERTAWSSLVCFGGLGTGEVVDRAGQKLVGISQRRTRAGVRFQCSALGAWAPADLIGLLDLDPDARRAAIADLTPRAAAVGVPLEDLLQAFLAALP